MLHGTLDRMFDFEIFIAFLRCSSCEERSVRSLEGRLKIASESLGGRWKAASNNSTSKGNSKENTRTLLPLEQHLL